MMKQLLLDILPPLPPTLDNFVSGRNSELLQALRDFLPGRECCIYLWGAPGSGKTHLLQAMIGHARQNGISAAYISCREKPGLEEELEQLEMVAVDDVEYLNDAGQIFLFGLFNRMREGRGKLLVSGKQAPAQTDLRQDLATRLGWGLVYQMHGLSDAEKTEALKAHARERGFTLSPEVADYLLSRWRRDLPSLLAVLDALDRYSLQAKRPITVPLLKELLGNL